MRRLTGLFAALLFVVAVSPAVASSTSDSATNDYTATVSEDMVIYHKKGELSSASSGAALITNDSDGNIEIEVAPSSVRDADGDGTDEAQATIAPHYGFSTNVDAVVKVNATGVNGEFGDGNDNATGKPLSDLTIREDDIADQLTVQLDTDSSTFQAATNTLSPVQDSGHQWVYQLDVPDDLSPGTYKATMTWKIIADSGGDSGGLQ